MHPRAAVSFLLVPALCSGAGDGAGTFGATPGACELITRVIRDSLTHPEDRRTLLALLLGVGVGSVGGRGLGGGGGSGGGGQVMPWSPATMKVLKTLVSIVVAPGEAELARVASLADALATSSSSSSSSKPIKAPQLSALLFATVKKHGAAIARAAATTDIGGGNADVTPLSDSFLSILSRLGSTMAKAAVKLLRKEVARQRRR